MSIPKKINTCCLGSQLKRAIHSISNGYQIIAKTYDFMAQPFHVHNFDISTGFEKISRRLIDEGAHINAADDDYNSALVFAAQKGNVHQ